MRRHSAAPSPREEPWAWSESSYGASPVNPDATLPLPQGRGSAPTRQLALPTRWQRTVAWLRVHLPFALVLLIATYLITINVTAPWQSMHEDNGTLNESIAINHIRYGLGVTKGQDVLDIEAKQSFGPQHVSEAQHFAYFLRGPTHPEVYGDHPPLLGLTIAGSFLLFGFHFWAERLVPIVYALAGLIVFYQLVSLLFDLGIARLAAFLYATFPMFAYFGRNVSHEAPTLFWALLLLTGYVRWRLHPQTRWLVLMVVAVVIGGAYGWPLFYFAPILFALDALAERRMDWRLARVTLLPALITLIVVMAQLVWVLNGDLLRLSEMFAYRTSGSNHGTSGTTIAWLQQITAWNAEGFGGWSQIALPAATLFVAAQASLERWSLRLRMLVICGAWGVCHMVIFRNGALIHAYWQFYLLPFYALALAWAAVTLARRIIPTALPRQLALCFAGFAVLCLNLAPIWSLYSTGYHVTLPVVPLFDLWR